MIKVLIDNVEVQVTKLPDLVDSLSGGGQGPTLEMIGPFPTNNNGPIQVQIYEDETLIFTGYKTQESTSVGAIEKVQISTQDWSRHLRRRPITGNYIMPFYILVATIIQDSGASPWFSNVLYRLPSELHDYQMDIVFKAQFLAEALEMACSIIGAKYRVKPSNGTLEIFQLGYSNPAPIPVININNLIGGCLLNGEYFKITSEQTIYYPVSAVRVYGRNGYNGSGAGRIELTTQDAFNNQNIYPTLETADKIISVQLIPKEAPAGGCSVGITTITGNNFDYNNGFGNFTTSDYPYLPTETELPSEAADVLFTIPIGSVSPYSLIYIYIVGAIALDVPVYPHLLVKFGETIIDEIDINSPAPVLATYSLASYSGQSGNVTVEVSIDAQSVNIFDEYTRIAVDAIASCCISIAYAGQLNSANFSGDGGLATSAQLNTPKYLASDSAGNIYISDSQNAAIRKVDVNTENINSIIGTGSSTSTPPTSGDPASGQQIGQPTGICVGSDGTVYFSDENQGTIGSINAAGDYYFITDPLTDYGYPPFGLAIDNTNRYLYAATRFGQVVLKVELDNSNNTSIYAGQLDNGGFSGDGGIATSGKLNQPTDVAVLSNGDLLIADKQNRRIRKVDFTTQNISTVVGDGSSTVVDGVDALSTGMGIAGENNSVSVDHFDNIYYFSGDPAIRKVDALTNIVTPVVFSNTNNLTLNVPPTRTYLSEFENYIKTCFNPNNQLFFSYTDRHVVVKINCSDFPTATVSGCNPEGFRLQSFQQFVNSEDAFFTVDLTDPLLDGHTVTLSCGYSMFLDNISLDPACYARLEFYINDTLVDTRQIDCDTSTTTASQEDSGPSAPDNDLTALIGTTVDIKITASYSYTNLDFSPTQVTIDIFCPTVQID